MSTKELMAIAKEVMKNIAARKLKTNGEVTAPKITDLRTFRQGNYTVVLVNKDYVGVANTGVRLALYRAVRKLFYTFQH